MCVSYNSANKGGNIVEVIREPFADITKELNGLRQVSHRVPDTHCTVHCLTNTHKCNSLHTFNRTCHMDKVCMVIL